MRFAKHFNNNKQRTDLFAYICMYVCKFLLRVFALSFCAHMFAVCVYVTAAVAACKNKIQNKI